MTRTVLTEAAEHARGDIRLLQAEHRRASRLRVRGPHGRIPGFEPSATERATQLVLTTIVAVAEHFSAERLRALPGTTENDAASWPKQEDAWLAHAGVTLANLSAYEAFRGFNEARNAIMHGRGTLTARQLATAYVATMQRRLAAAGIRNVRGRLVIGGADLDRCADICAEFVRQLDTAAP